MPLLDVKDLSVFFHTRGGVVRAVEGVSFTLEKGETLGIVGESGSGKSVTGRALLGLVPKPIGRIESGVVDFDGVDLLTLSADAFRSVRGRRISMIFQDPMTSLNPYLKVGTQLIEPLRLHAGLAKDEAWKQGIKALEEVGVTEAERRIHFYPHEFSGGMRQRVMIAMALISDPELVIADEPTTALDVTVQAQILDLLQERQRARGAAMLLITHDLGVVAGRCDRVLVMYAGQVMEMGTVEEIFESPQHPYTVALQRSLPSRGEKGKALFALPGLPPDVSKPIPGDPFALREGLKNGGRWLQERPPLVRHSPTHWARSSDVVLAERKEVLDG